MPAAITEEEQSGPISLKYLQNSLDDLGDAVSGQDDDIEFLKDFLGNPILESLIQAQDTLEECPEEQDEQRACKKVADVIDAITEMVGQDRDATQLDGLLSDPHLRALLQAYDDVIEKNFEEEGMSNQNTLLSPPPPVFSAVSDQIRLVGIRKSKTELLGITVKIDEVGDLVIARIMSGSMIDRQGLLHVGDIIKEINGMQVVTPEQLMDIIKNTDGDITLKIVPTYLEQQTCSQVYMKAHFNYDPMKDRLIPCKEAGLVFRDGDILQILSSDDPNFWQARKVDDESIPTGLIPSQSLEEKRKAYVQPDNDYTKSSLLCGLSRRKKKKIKYTTKNNKDFHSCEIMIYEEVTRMPPFQRKTLVLVGANGVGRRSLKERLIRDDPRRFAAAMPHTSRAPREGEEHGRGYFFTDYDTVIKDIKEDKFLEHGEFNGNLYGTKLETIHNVMRSGKMCVLDVNPTSLKRLKNPEFMPYIIFIAAPSSEAMRVMFEEGRRRGFKIKRSGSGPGMSEIRSEEDFLQAIQESTQIERVYKSYFDMTVVNDTFDETYRTIRKTLNSLSSETQWVPVNWVY